MRIIKLESKAELPALVKFSNGVKKKDSAEGASVALAPSDGATELRSES